MGLLTGPAPGAATIIRVMPRIWPVFEKRLIKKAGKNILESLNLAMPLLGSCSRSAILASARPIGSMKLNAIRLGPVFFGYFSKLYRSGLNY
jgi:hypothetical protein